MVTFGVPSSGKVGLAARKRFLVVGSILAAQGKRSVPSAFSSGTGIFWTGIRGNSLTGIGVGVCFFFWFLSIPSTSVGQNESRRLLRCSGSKSHGVDGVGGVAEGLKSNGFSQAPIEGTNVAVGGAVETFGRVTSFVPSSSLMISCEVSESPGAAVPRFKHSSTRDKVSGGSVTAGSDVLARRVEVESSSH